jgi:hypothetical protein
VWGLVSARGRELGPLARTVARLGRAIPREPAVRDAAVSSVLGIFFTEWARAAAPLAAVRVGRSLHIAAFALALGAIAGMYVRGLVLEYRAGWESTFISAEAVHALLAFVLGPASALTGIRSPTCRGSRRCASARAGGRERGAVDPPVCRDGRARRARPAFLLGMAPGSASAGSPRTPARARRPVLRAADRQLRGEPARVRWSLQLPARAAGVLGCRRSPPASSAARGVSVAPGISWGGEDALPKAGARGRTRSSRSFRSPRPSREPRRVPRGRRGARRRRAGCRDRRRVGFRKRFAQQPRGSRSGGAWRELFAARGEPVFVDLEAPDHAVVDAAIERSLQAEARA